MRIVLCDDHGMLLDALRATLEAQGHRVVACCLTREDGLVAVRDLAPDVCLIDLHFPAGSGLDVVPQMLESSPGTRVLVLSASGGTALVKAALAAGAAAFLRKDQRVEGIVQGLRQLEDGQAVAPLPLLPTQRPARSEIGSAAWRLRFLTEREGEVLQRILAGETTVEMAVAMRITRSTARTHVQNVLNKLGVHSRLQAAALVSPCGYALAERPR